MARRPGRVVPIVKNEPIAIVGIGCRLPGGADDPQTLWTLLRDGFDAVGPIPSMRFDVDALFDERPATPGKIMSRWGGFIEGIEDFDASFFGISPREAQRLDPQQRLLLETAWEALEDAGIPADRLAGTSTGVFVGMWLNDYESRLFSDTDGVDFHMTTGTGRYSASGRLSYFLDLRGPSITIDTACSSSLVAVHLACQSLRSAECDVVLAGGANVILAPHITIAYSQSRMMAPDGRCKFGDTSADGYVRSDGAAMVVLKRLSSAQADGDPIYALIRGSAVTNDGASSGFLATPGQAGQEDMLRRAYASAGVDPRSVQYVEAHGTGTAAGDPVELGALGAVVGAGRSVERPCLVGSIKTNVGHTEGAAGVAGLIKVALALRHREIPASLHVTTLNPRIPWRQHGLDVCTSRRPWVPDGGPARGGVSAFGIAGTNAHVVLEAAPEPVLNPAAPLFAGPPERARNQLVLAFSAHDPAALRALAQRYLPLVSAATPAALGSLCAGAARARAHHEYRVAVVAADQAALVAGITAFLDDVTHPGVYSGRSGLMPPRVAFVFPGQGSQWPGMVRDLLATNSVFGDAMRRADAAIQTETGWSLLDQLTMDGPHNRLADIDVIQPALFAIEVALAELWRSLGVEPDALVGHSMGEVAAAHVAGALSLRDAVAVVCCRSRLLGRVVGHGAMAVVDLSMEEAEHAIGGHRDVLSIAVSNSPRSTVISGDPEAVAAVVNDLTSSDVFCRLVNVDVASHSAQMDPLLSDLRAALADIESGPTSLALHSTVDAAVVDGTSLDAEYWARNLRQPVLFSSVASALAADEHRVFVELSPHPILVPALEQVVRVAANPGVGVLATLRRAESGWGSICHGLAALYVRGTAVRWDAVFSDDRALGTLPRYPWQRLRHWYDEPMAGSPANRLIGQGGHPLLGHAVHPATDVDIICWETSFDLQQMPYLDHHRVRGSALMPASGFIEMMLAATNAWNSVMITELSLRQAMELSDRRPHRLQVSVEGDGASEGSVRIYGAGEGEAWQLHAQARVTTSRNGAASVPAPSLPSDPRDRLTAPGLGTLFVDDHVTLMARRGLHYGPAFQLVQESWRGPGEALGRLAPKHADEDRVGRRITLLDAALQLVVAAIRESTPGTFVPVAIDQLRIVAWPRDDDDVWGHAMVVRTTADAIRADVTLRDPSGVVLFELQGVTLHRVGRDGLDQLRFELRWDAAPLVSASPLAAARLPAIEPVQDTDPWIVFRAAGIGTELVRRLHADGQQCIIVTPGPSYVRSGPLQYCVDPGSPAQFVTLLQDITATQTISAPRIVYAWAASISPDDADPMVAAELLGVAAPLALVQAIEAVPAIGRPRLWLVTSGAQRLDGSAVNAAQAVLWGLGRSVATELPALQCTLIDVDAGTGIGSLVDEIRAGSESRQVALRASGRSVVHLVRAGPATDVVPSLSAADSFRLVATTPGNLDGVVPITVARRAPGLGEIEVRIEAAGLNFLDVLKAMDTYPSGPEAQQGSALGGECAGVVVAVGPGVVGLEAGEAVVAITPSFDRIGMLGSFVTLPAELVVPRPLWLSAEAGAALPVAYLTAYYALHILGRIRQGDRVLIHSASGGVGLAALAVCRRAGAEVYATAGTAEKREYLRSLGIAHVFDSRGLEFGAEVLAATGGRGVDLVLNSLVGRAITVGLEVLSEQGRFLEIGKRDVYGDTRVGLWPFRKNLSMSVVDLARLVELDQPFVARMLREVMDLVSQRELPILPITAVALGEAVGAFRSMAGADHVGKVVLRIPAGTVEVQTGPVNAHRTYLITGGLGALGLAVAHRLVERGARNIVLLGRSGPTPHVASAIAALVVDGVRVMVVEADVSCREEVESALERVRGEMAPLGGVVHAAGVLADGTVTDLDPTRVHQVLAPKLAGGWNLHLATSDDDLDFFVLFSSVSSILGLAGQANYAAANAFLDALAQQRRQLGLRATSINWGPWGEAGLAAADDARGERLAQRGLGSLTTTEALDCFDMLLGDDDAQAIVMRFDASRWCAADPASEVLLSLLANAPTITANAPQADLRKTLLSIEPGRRRRNLMEGAVCAQLGPVLRANPDDIDRQGDLKSMGLDSLMALELRNRLELETGLTLSATIAWNHPTVTRLAGYLAARMEVPLEMGQRDALSENVLRHPSEDLSNELAGDLSDDEVAALLRDELATIDRLLDTGRDA